MSVSGSVSNVNNADHCSTKRTPARFLVFSLSQWISYILRRNPARAQRNLSYSVHSLINPVMLYPLYYRENTEKDNT